MHAIRITKKNGERIHQTEFKFEPKRYAKKVALGFREDYPADEYDITLIKRVEVKDGEV